MPPTSTPWLRWGAPDPAHEAAGVRFDHAPSGPIRAPAGTFRVCAYHVDFDERPTCYRDVKTIGEAQAAATSVLHSKIGWNVDFATVYDDRGRVVGSNCPWAETPFRTA